MTWTRHGHHIDGTVKFAERSRPRVMRCGGPRFCDKCEIDVKNAQPHLEDIAAPMAFVSIPTADKMTYIKDIVSEKYNRDIIDIVDTPPIDIDQVFIVWFSKTLDNWKAIAVTATPDERYYEVTHNGAKNESYLDTYIKIHNEVISSNNR